MKLKYEFVERLIVDEYVLVPTGEAARSFAGMITTSEVGAFLIKTLKNDVTKEDLIALLMEEYEVDKETAYNDVETFLEQLNALNLLSQ